MPDRVVTADLETLLGVPVIAVVGVPYNEEAAGIPAPLRGGRFLDLIIAVPPGTADAGALHPQLHEALSTAPGQLKRQADGGQLHEIWGWPKAAGPLDPGDPDDAQRIAGSRTVPVVLDLGRALNSRVYQAQGIPAGNGRVIAELQIENPGPVANRPLEAIYDTLDAHPPGLRTAIERSAWVRRETASDPPPGWRQAKGIP